MSKLAQIFARGVTALEADDLEGLQAAAADANKARSDESDPRARYLRFMSVWLDQNADEQSLDELFAEAGELIEAASKVEDPSAAGRMVLDLADVLLDAEEIDEAEHAVRSLLEREDLDERTDAEARMLQAQILMDFHEDIEEALVQLDGVAASLRERPGYVSMRAAVLLELGRDDEAFALLRAAITRDDDTELRYQLGMMLRQAGHADEALEQLLVVRERDLKQHEIDGNDPVPDDEAADLGRYLEDVLDSLPEPVMERLASAAIRVERWPSAEAVRKGVDPRGAIAFEGTPARDDDDGKVESMVVYRDAIVAQIESDEEIVSALAMGLVEEVDRFLDLEMFPGD